MTQRSPGLRNVALALAVLATGALGAELLARNGIPHVAPPLQVPVTTAPPADGPVAVRAQGPLVPARQVTIRAEVAGRVAQVAPNLAPGTRVRAGEALVRIDDRDYRLAVQRRQADVDRARSDLELEQGRGAVAKHEWRLLGADAPSDRHGRALALRAPQQRSAEAAVRAARSALEQAKLALERTRLAAPFDAEVREEGVDVGQFVQPGQDVATLVGTDAWWAEIRLPPRELAWLDVPGARATISQDRGGQSVTRTGRAIQLASDGRLLVQVDDPLGLKTARPPLLLDAPVEVTLQGHPATGVRAVPPAALTNGDAVWTVEPIPGRSNAWRLQPRPVHLVHVERDRVLVRAADLPPDIRVVTAPLAAPAAHMRVRPVERPAPPARDEAPGA